MSAEAWGSGVQRSRVARALLGHDVNLGDRAFRAIATLFALAILLLLAALTLELVEASAPALRRFGPGFLVERRWDPVREEFGALPFVFGTLASSALALALSLPVALGVAIYLAELAPPGLRGVLGFLTELLAAVPSVIYGFWGLFVLGPLLRERIEPLLADLFGFLPFFRGTPRGTDILSAGVVLAIMILPTIASVSREVLRAVPGTLREAALALGSTRWEAIRTAVLPVARSGILGAVILGLGRALGETMAVTMVIGNRPEISASLFAPAATLASVIANEFTEATGDVYLSALSALALVLFATTILLNILARLLIARVARLPGGAGRL